MIKQRYFLILSLFCLFAVPAWAGGMEYEGSHSYQSNLDDEMDALEKEMIESEMATASDSWSFEEEMGNVNDEAEEISEKAETEVVKLEDTFHNSFDDFDETISDSAQDEVLPNEADWGSAADVEMEDDTWPSRESESTVSETWTSAPSSFEDEPSAAQDAVEEWSDMDDVALEDDMVMSADEFDSGEVEGMESDEAPKSKMFTNNEERGWFEDLYAERLSTNTRHQKNYFEEAGTAYKRGITNAVTFPLEIPQTIQRHDEAEEQRPVIRHIAGFVDGTFRALTRATSVAWDLTFGLIPGNQENHVLPPDTVV